MKREFAELDLNAPSEKRGSIEEREKQKRMKAIEEEERMLAAEK